MVGGLAIDGGIAGRADGQYDSVLQFQGSAVDAEAAGISDPFSHLDWRGYLGFFGSSARFAGLYVCGDRRFAASRTVHPPSHGVADRVIHALA